MAVPHTTQRLTEAEYLGIERAAETKSEFFDGEMFAIAGGARRHGKIAMNLGREVGGKLRDRRSEAFNAAVRVKIEATGLYTYPDLSVVCGDNVEAEDDQDVIVNPILIAEVLSESTEGYDRGKKFEHYRQIPALREYLLISQNEPRIEQFVLEPGRGWFLREAVGLGATLALPSIEITISLSEVFRKVKFPPPATPAV